MKQLTKFQKIAIFVFLIVIALGFLDVQGKMFWDKPVQFASFFWTFSYLIAIALSILYFLIRKDKSESISIFVLFAGFLFSVPHLGNIGWLPESNPYLYNTPVIGGIAKMMGLSSVTPLSLIISVIVGGFITYKIAKYLFYKL